MTTTTQTPPLPRTTNGASATARTVHPISMSRLAMVELRKMFDTRAGFWLMAWSR